MASSERDEEYGNIGTTIAAGYLHLIAKRGNWQQQTFFCLTPEITSALVKKTFGRAAGKSQHRKGRISVTNMVYPELATEFNVTPCTPQETVQLMESNVDRGQSNGNQRIQNE
jgi:hypothetical protein